MVRRILLIGGVLASCGACSSTSGDAATTSAAAVAATVPQSSAAPATLAGEIEPMATDDPYCVALRSVEGIDAVQELAAADVTEIAAAVDVASAAVGQMPIVAPVEVRADWATLASAYGELFGSFRGAGFDVTALMSDPSASIVFERFASREVLDAGDRAEQHAEAACGISLGLGRNPTDDDEPEIAATDTTLTGAPLGDDEAAEVGRRLLEEFGLTATLDQQRCLGRAVSDPATVASLPDTGSGLDRYRALAAGCGIDIAPLG